MFDHDKLDFGDDSEFPCLIQDTLPYSSCSIICQFKGNYQSLQEGLDRRISISNILIHFGSDKDWIPARTSQLS